MAVWQVDLYRRPLQNANRQPLWELLVCDEAGAHLGQAWCPQPQVSADWLVAQIRSLPAWFTAKPDRVQVFRPQSLALMEVAAQTLGLIVEPTRHTPALKQWLHEQALVYPQLEGYTGAAYHPDQLDSPPPQPMPEDCWGDRWRFASLPAATIITAFQDQPIPIKVIPAHCGPIQMGLASTTLIPGVVIDGGRQSMRLARWVQSVQPNSLHYVAGGLAAENPGGLVLEAGLVDRWIMATFDDPEVLAAAATFNQRQQASQGLHFLLVQPDDSGMTYSGFWLLVATDR